MLGITYVSRPLRTEIDIPVTTPTVLQKRFTPSSIGDTVSVKLPACGIARELIFMYSPDDPMQEPHDQPFFQTCTLKLNSQPILLPARGPEYFSSYLLYRNHKFTPRASPDTPRLHVLPFTDCMKNGGLDLVAFHDVRLEFVASKPRTGTLTVYIITRNIMTIKDGMMHMRYMF
jgi:hypothetical protein